MVQPEGEDLDLRLGCPRVRGGLSHVAGVWRKGP